MRDLTPSELESQTSELLPSRETLNVDVDWAAVFASNTSLALNAASIFANAESTAHQTVVVLQQY